MSTRPIDITGSVIDSGGGRVVIGVDPDTDSYPPHSARVHLTDEITNHVAPPVLDTPADDKDLRAGPEDVTDLTRIDHRALLKAIARAAIRYDDARAAQIDAGRAHAQALAETASARAQARQLAAELNRRLAR